MCDRWHGSENTKRTERDKRNGYLNACSLSQKRLIFYWAVLVRRGKVSINIVFLKSMNPPNHSKFRNIDSINEHDMILYTHIFRNANFTSTFGTFCFALGVKRNDASIRVSIVLEKNTNFYQIKLLVTITEFFFELLTKFSKYIPVTIRIHVLIIAGCFIPLILYLKLIHKTTQKIPSHWKNKNIDRFHWCIHFSKGFID